MADANRTAGVPNFPAGVNEFLSDEPPAMRGKWFRILAVASGYVVASVAYIAAFMTPNTSYGHHLFAGPLVALYQSPNPADFAVGFAIWGGLGASLCWWAFRPSVLAAVFIFASAVAWVTLGVWAAGVASC